MKFLIKGIDNPIEYDGNAVKWGTGETPFVDYSIEMHGRKTANNKIKFRTGLNKVDILSNKELTDDEKNIYLEKLDTFLPKILKAFPELKIKDSEDVADDDEVFWNTDRNTLRIKNSTFSDVFDTDANSEDLLLYFAIVGGSFANISPTLDIAERNGNSYYLTDENEFTEKIYEEEYGDKRKAIAALDSLLESKGIDPLLYISYLTVPENKGFTRNTSKAVFEKALMEYIEGKNTKTAKKEAAKNFIKHYKLFKADKEAFIGKAILSAAHHYQLIYEKDKKYITSVNGTVLGTTLETSYSILMKPENAEEFQTIRDKVNEKLSK